MQLLSKKSVRIAFGSFFLPAAIAFKDSSYFLPLAGHSDLRFQAVGECIEIIALALLVLLLGVSVKDGGDSEPFPVTLRLRILVAAFFAIFLLTIFWRDFFPNDQFNLSAGSIDFLYAPLGGLGIVAMSYVSGPTREKPSKEEERSVV